MSILSLPNDLINIENPFIIKNKLTNEENNQNDNNISIDNNNDIINRNQIDTISSKKDIQIINNEYLETNLLNINSINEIEHYGVQQPERNKIEIHYVSNCLFGLFLPLILLILGFCILIMGNLKDAKFLFLIFFCLVILAFFLMFINDTIYTFVLENNYIVFKQTCRRSIIYKQGDIEKIEFYSSYDKNKIRKHLNYLALYTKEGKKEIINSRSCYLRFYTKETQYARYIINKHIISNLNN